MNNDYQDLIRVLECERFKTRALKDMLLHTRKSQIVWFVAGIVVGLSIALVLNLISGI